MADPAGRIRYWALLAPNGSVRELRPAPTSTDLDWVERGTPAGWTWNEVSGMRFAYMAETGIPVKPRA